MPMPLILTFAAALCLGLLASPARAEPPFNLFCANKVFEVDQRNWTQMKTLRGPDVCNFGEFNTAADAERHARLYGGVGTKCSCR